jgi:hypothetical protein
MKYQLKYMPPAQVAELADALGSGLSECILMRVQIPPWAQVINRSAANNSISVGFFVNDHPGVLVATSVPRLVG